MAKTKEAVRVVLDYPEENATITSHRYTFRIGGMEEVKRAEISIDDAPWQACRQAIGYWWYDWAGYKKGSHRVLARVETQDGQTVTSEPREFNVELSSREEQFSAN